MGKAVGVSVLACGVALGGAVAPALAQWQPLDPARELPPLPLPGSDQQPQQPQTFDQPQTFQQAPLDPAPEPQTLPGLDGQENGVAQGFDQGFDQGANPGGSQVDPNFDPYGQNQGQQTTEAPAGELIENPVAVFSGLDKITARITSFDVYMGETVQFGALQLTPKVCHTRPATENPETTAFVQVDEITLNNEVRRIFSGWMYAGSPGLHAVEHAVYDVWLTNCKTSSSVPPPEGYDGPPVEAGAEQGLDPLAGEAETGKTGIPVPKP